MTNENFDLSKKLDSLHDHVEDVKDSGLFRKLDYLQGEIENLKESLIADKYRAATDTLMKDATDVYKSNLSEIIYNFVEDINIEDIKGFDYNNTKVGTEVIEEAKVISDKFTIRLKSEFSESEFIDEWKSGEIPDSEYRFNISYSPSKYEMESISLYLKDVKDGEIIFLIDENELKEMEFLRTLFVRSPHWELQVIRKSDLKFELIEFGEEVDKTEIEFETIKFK